MAKTTDGRPMQPMVIGRWIMGMLLIAACLNATGACAQEAKDAPQISDIRLLRKLGDYTQALGYVNALLADKATSNDVRREAYNELVTIAFLTEGGTGAQSAAQTALTEFPDLKTDPAHHPEEIERIYDDLRRNLFGRLHLTSDPAGCMVSLEGRELGSTPLEGIYLPAGEYVLRLGKFGYTDDTLHVRIAGGGELKRFAHMRLLRNTAALRIGFEVALSSVSLSYGRGTGGKFAGLGMVGDYESATTFSGGVFLQTMRHDRLAVQVGARYGSQGNRAEYQMSGGYARVQYDLDLRYLAAPVLMKFYPFEKPRIFGCFGAELAYLLSASLSEAGGGESIDIVERLQRLQVSLVFGGGLELGVGGHSLTISAFRVMGQTSLRKSEKLYEIDCEPREWRIALGYLL